MKIENYVYSFSYTVGTGTVYVLYCIYFLKFSSYLQVVEQYIYALKNRETELLTRLKAIHAVKFQTLDDQQQQLR